MSILGVEAHVHVNLTAISLRQRHEQSRDDRVARDRMKMFTDDADNFHVARRAILRRLRVTNVLPDCVFVRKKFFRHFFVNDGNTTRVLLLAFLLSEIAAAQQLYAKRIEVTGRRRGVERICAWVGRFRIVRHGVFRAHNSTCAREIRVRQHCTRG